MSENRFTIEKQMQNDREQELADIIMGVMASIALIAWLCLY